MCSLSSLLSAAATRQCVVTKYSNTPCSSCKWEGEFFYIISLWRVCISMAAWLMAYIWERAAPSLNTVYKLFCYQTGRQSPSYLSARIPVKITSYLEYVKVCRRNNWLRIKLSADIKLLIKPRWSVLWSKAGHIPISFPLFTANHSNDNK